MEWVATDLGSPGVLSLARWEGSGFPWHRGCVAMGVAA